ncbi:MAG: SPOR domain-containing protein [Candidatus Hydrogenedentes bacterium]|nr:SPOR domain-containing protein [Candidatus Hydrogenedentota bacterium]
MPRHSTYRSRGAVESASVEWSSGQLGIGIAVALIFGIVCFMLGYVVANVDRPIDPAQITIASDSPRPSPSGANAAVTPPANTPPSAPAAGAPRTAANPPAGTPVSPSRAADPARKPDVAPLPDPGRPTTMVKTPIDINTLPAQGSQDAATPTAGASLPDITPPAETVSTPPAAPQKPADTTASAPAPRPVPAPAPATPAATTTTTTTTTTAAASPSPAPQAPTVTRGSYGVQVAAFNGPQRAAQAQEARRKLKSATGLDADIVTSPDGAFEKVVITGFATRDAARAQCDKVKAKPGYDGAWVIRLP